MQELLNNKGIIRTKLKIKAAINNAKIFYKIEEEYNSFKNYLLRFHQGIIYENDKLEELNEIKKAPRSDVTPRSWTVKH